MAKTLGEFEQMILFALLQLEDGEAYGVTIRQAIEQRTGRSVSSGAIYTALNRLEAGGLVTTWASDPTSARGGRRKRLVGMEPAGLEALQQSVRMFEAMSNGVLHRLRS